MHPTLRGVFFVSVPPSVKFHSDLQVKNNIHLDEFPDNGIG